MYTAERQRAQPYLDQVSGPLFEQWYLLHHRMVRLVTNHRALAEQVRHFLYYAELLGEYTYDHPSQLPIAIPIDLLWQAGQRLYRPVALTCYLFALPPGEPFPPPAEVKPDDIEWVEIPGVDGPLRARWKRDTWRFREFQAYPGVSSRICSAVEREDLHGTIFIEDVDKCAPWFVMRYVFYMVLGVLLSYNGYEIVHCGAIALDGAGALLVGSPASGKTTLLLSCLHIGMQFLGDDVLFLARDDGVVGVYAFPEDIGVRSGTTELLGQYPFMQALREDERRKRFIDIQQYFRGQVIDSSPVRLLLFMRAEQRSAEFRAELLSPAQAVSWLTQEYISHQRAQDGGAEHMFDIFTDMATQAAAYRLWLSPDVMGNAAQVRALLEQRMV